MNFCPSGIGWSESEIGQRLSCLAICEYVEHPVFMKSGVKNATVAKKVFSTNVPEKYFLIRNNDIIRVRYLVVYSQINKVEHVPALKSQKSVINYIKQNKAVFSILFYIFFLACIGMLSSKNGIYYRQLLWRKFKKYFVNTYDQFL